MYMCQIHTVLAQQGAILLKLQAATNQGLFLILKVNVLKSGEQTNI